MYKMLPIWCLMGWLYTCMLTNFSSTENVDLSGLNYTSLILHTHFKGSKFVRAQQYHMNRNQPLTKNSLISSSSVSQQYHSQPTPHFLFTVCVIAILHLLYHWGWSVHGTSQNIWRQIQDWGFSGDPILQLTLVSSPNHINQFWGRSGSVSDTSSP